MSRRVYDPLGGPGAGSSAKARSVATGRSDRTIPWNDATAAFSSSSAMRTISSLSRTFRPGAPMPTSHSVMPTALLLLQQRISHKMRWPFTVTPSPWRNGRMAARAVNTARQKNGMPC